MEIPRFRSIGDILYEMTLWLLFYPRALWRVLLRPVVAESDAEGEPITPPLFLLLSILAAHALDLALRAAPDASLAGLDLGLLAFRVVAFSLFPLVMAVGGLRREGRSVDRQTLRGPFDLQCLYAAPFAISVSVAAVLTRSADEAVRLAGAGLIVAATTWYLCVETRWLRARLGVGALRAFGAATRLFVLALGLCLGVAVLGLRAAG